MFASLVRRDRRSLWGTLSLVLIVGAGVAMLFAGAEQRGIEREATRRARLTAQVGIAPLLEPRDLETPAEGSRYDVLDSGIRSAVLEAGQPQNVTLLGQDGRILFSSNVSEVGTRQQAMENLLFGVANGQATSDVAQGWFRTFVPLWLQPGGTIIVAELDQPYAPIVAEANRPWRVSALECVALALATMTLFGLTFRAKAAVATGTGLTPVPAPAPKRVPRHDVPVDGNSPAYMLPGYREEAEARREAEARAAALEENFRGLQKQYRAALEQLKGLEQQVQLQQTTSSRSESDVHLVRDELQQTAQRLHQIEIDRDAVKERLALRQSELAAVEGRAHEAETRAAQVERELERATAELEHLEGRPHMSKLQDALLELDGDDDENANGDGNGSVSVPRLTLRLNADEPDGVPATGKAG